MTDVPAVRLQPHRDKRARAGHPWVFSNEIDGPVKDLPPGGTVDVFDAKGKFLGRGYANPASLITIRLVTRARREDIDHPAFWAWRLRQAAERRALVYPDRRSLRLVYSEADGLPGLIIDRYGDVLSVQVSTLGVETRLDALRTAIEDVFAPAGVILRNEAAVRDLEGLPRERRVWWGEVPDTVAIDESGVTFHVPLTGGQKTGHFFDQHDNKLWAAPRCVGRDVLDVYANTGGWALHALKAGARSATVVDSDAANMELAARNAASNGVDDKLTVIAAEGKRTLQELVARGARFGAVVLDPPAFAKQRKAANSALKGYREINALACMLLEEGGLLFTSTCSFHVEEDRFVEAVAEGARDASRRLVMLRRGGPSADHPVLPGVPETRYLKSFAFQAHLDA